VPKGVRAIRLAKPTNINFAFIAVTLFTLFTLIYPRYHHNWLPRHGKCESPDSLLLSSGGPSCGIWYGSSEPATFGTSKITMPRSVLDSWAPQPARDMPIEKAARQSQLRMVTAPEQSTIM
jgi:hypothetical protein